MAQSYRCDEPEKETAGSLLLKYWTDGFMTRFNYFELYIKIDKKRQSIWICRQRLTITKLNGVKIRKSEKESLLHFIKRIKQIIRDLRED